MFRSTPEIQGELASDHEPMAQQIKGSVVSIGVEE